MFPVYEQQTYSVPCRCKFATNILITTTTTTITIISAATTTIIPVMPLGTADSCISPSTLHLYQVPVDGVPISNRPVAKEEQGGSQGWGWKGILTRTLYYNFHGNFVLTVDERKLN